jgi:maltooligosyltrehalose trehalohydrolase
MGADRAVFVRGGCDDDRASERMSARKAACQHKRNRAESNLMLETATSLSSRSIPLGASFNGSCCTFNVWAPNASHVAVRLDHQPEPIALEKDKDGYHVGAVESVPVGARYKFILNGSVERPDPASRFQPDGVHGASSVVTSTFDWSDQHWFGLPLRDYIIYELHVGTFTRQGTFEAMISRLPELKELGVTAIELMPVAQFPGARNWGYDGVFPFAAQNSYGGPDALKRFVDAAHGHGLAVILDVVYNHLGPEGNSLRDFGPYFTTRYKTPWGEALNFDGEHSDHVRRFFIENALYWQTEFHVDALRLDAVHAIHDESATPFLTELARATSLRSEQLNRRFHLIAESDLNDVRLILPEHLGGKGIDAQWSDDFHHSLHVLITGEHDGYYADFTGGVRQFAKVLEQGFAYTGEYAPSRKRRHGNSPELAAPKQFVVCSQNHDQVGNRMLGERLGALTSFEGLKLAAAAVLLSPFTPLLFMGEEWGEQPPFHYFISHTDDALVEAVRKGRREEFAAFAWQGEVPDPQAERTFDECIIDPARCEQRHQALRDFYRELIQLRKRLHALVDGERRGIAVQCHEAEQTVVLEYGLSKPVLLAAFCFSIEPVSICWPACRWRWQRALYSADERWFGEGSTRPEKISPASDSRLALQPRSAVVFTPHPSWRE